MDKYTQILKEELIPAMGCTEPIAVALAAAKARDVLGMLPTEIVLDVSGSIIKNVKSVIVPNTGNMKGLKAAAAVGIVGGKTEKMLEVIADVSESQLDDIKKYLKETKMQVKHAPLGRVFDIVITAKADGHKAIVRIADYHTNFVYVEKDGNVLLHNPLSDDDTVRQTDRTILSINGIWEYINNCSLEELKSVLQDQVRCNLAIAEEGLKNNYGANIGKTILAMHGTDLMYKAIASAAAGSDARMSGCEMPVVINSGSGNQGMTTSIPVIVYAKGLNVSEEKLYRALALANLVTIHQKTGIGTLSAYCGAMSAGCGAGCGIAYLLGADIDLIKHTLTNAVATVSGVICDGAKPSCASKIATAVQAGIMGYYMAKAGNNFNPGDGIVGEDVEATIKNVGKLAAEGMAATNDTIIDIMIEGGK